MSPSSPTNFGCSGARAWAGWCSASAISARCIQQYVGDGDAFDLRVTYSRETGKLLGTGGALRLALPMLGTAFFVLYGDSYLDIDYEAVQRAFEASDAPALMTVYRNEGRWDASNVLFDGTRVVRYDKRRPSPDMRYIDYGLGVLSAPALREPAEDAFDLADVYAGWQRTAG